MFIFLMHLCSLIIKHYLFEVPICVALAKLCLLGQNKTSHFGIFLATGVAVYLHNSDRKITLQKHTKYQPSKGEGKTPKLPHTTDQCNRKQGVEGGWYLLVEDIKQKRIVHACLDSM